MSNSLIDFTEDVLEDQVNQNFTEEQMKKIKNRIMLLIFISYLLMPIVSIVAFILKLLDASIFIIVIVILIGLVIQLCVVYLYRQYMKD